MTCGCSITLFESMLRIKSSGQTSFNQIFERIFLDTSIAYDGSYYDNSGRQLPIIKSSNNIYKHHNHAPEQMVHTWYNQKKKDDISLLPSICTILLRYVTKNRNVILSFISQFPWRFPSFFSIFGKPKLHTQGYFHFLSFHFI